MIEDYGILTGADAYFVNLAQRPDRRVLCEAELARVGLPAERFEAMTADDYRGTPQGLAAMLARPQRGAIGCWLSQRAVLQRGIDANRSVLVLEDDVMFCDDLRERMRYVERVLPAIDQEWDVLSLGGCFHVPGIWHKKTLDRDVQVTSDPRILRLYGSWFTWAYLVRRESLAKVADLLDWILPHSHGIDHSFILLADRVRSYCFVPGCSKQRDGKSNIGSGDTIFSSFSMLGPYWFQPRAEDFDPGAFDWKDAR